MNNDGPERDAVSERIIACTFTVANMLGGGFLEKVYENALALELRAAGFAVEQQQPIGVAYRGVLAGEYFVDLLVDGTILIELKTVRALASRAVYPPADDRQTALPADQFRQAAYRGSTDCR